MLSIKNLQRLIILGRNLQKTETSCIRSMKSWQRPVLYVLQSKKQQLKFQAINGVKVRPRYEYVDWNYKAELYAFGKRLGENFDDRLLSVALTDRSFVVKQLQEQADLNMSEHVGDIPDNAPLAVEGENILTRCVEETLCREYPKLPEDGINSITAFLTSTSMLSNICSLLGTKDLILCKDYPPSRETYATVFKAIIAVLEKSSGPERVHRFICDIVLTQLSGLDLFDIWQITHPWSKLTYVMKKHGMGTPEPRLIAQAGPNTVLAAYIVGLYDTNKSLMGKGYGETIEIAQEMAARDVLREMFGIRRPANGFKFLVENTQDHTKRLTSSS